MAKTLFTIVTRVLVCFATAAALIVMLTNNEKVELGTFTLEARYTDWGALRYFVVANGITSCYSLLVVWIPSGSLLWRSIAAVDVVITILIATSGAAAAALVDNMKKGNILAGWTPYYSVVPAFCDRVMGALVVCCFGGFLQFLLALYTFGVVINPLLVKQ